MGYLISVFVGMILYTCLPRKCQQKILDIRNKCIDRVFRKRATERDKAEVAKATGSE